MRLAKVFVVSTVAHFILTVVVLITGIGAAYGAHRGWEEHSTDRISADLADVLTAPIGLARQITPAKWHVGYGLGELVLNSVLWALLITSVVLAVRGLRSRPAV